MAKTRAKPALPQYVGRDDVASALGISTKTLKRMIDDGSFPQPARLSPNRIGWPVAVVEQHMADRMQQLTKSAVANPDDLTPDQLADATFDLAARHAAAITGRPATPLGIVAAVELTADEDAARTAAMWDHMRDFGPRHIGMQRSILAAFWLFPALRDVFRALKTVGPKLPPADAPEEAICSLGVTALDDERWKLATESQSGR